MSRHPLLFAALAVLALSALRLIHLEADTPVNLGLTSAGPYVDEGYKTLDARNLDAFGSVRWNSHDEFAGWWSKDSILSQALYYLSFLTLGESLGSARLVAVLWFALFLWAYVYGTWRDYPRWLFYLGLLLLSLVHIVFFFSRLALLVQPLITCLYWTLFLMRRRPLRAFGAALLICSSLLLTALLVKASAVVYYPPLLIGALVALLISDPTRRQRLLWVTAGVVATVTAIAVSARDYWHWLISGFELPHHPREFLLYPLTESSALLIAAGLFCTFHWLATRPREFWESAYRTSLVALVLVGPAVLWILPYAPVRYWAPLLPAFLLLVLEWLHLRSWELPLRRGASPWITAACVPVLLWALLCLGRAASKYALGSLEVWREFGAESRILFPYAELALVGAAVSIWVFRRRLLSGKVFLGVVVLTLILGVSRDLYLVGGFLAYPSYRSREIAAALDRLVPAGQSIAGDWAPFFALGTDMKALRMSGGFNVSVPIRALRPDFFLFSGTKEDRRLRHRLRSEEGVALEAPVLETTYIDRRIALYPIRYAEE